MNSHTSTTPYRRRLIVAARPFVFALALSAVGAGAVGAQSADPSATALEAGASNMGVCSSYLGRAQVRDDVNALLPEFGYLGEQNRGGVYSNRAKLHGSENATTPEAECRQRSQH